MKYPLQPLSPFAPTSSAISADNPDPSDPQAALSFHHRFSTPFFPATYKSLFQQLFCFVIYTKPGGVDPLSLAKTSSATKNGAILAREGVNTISIASTEH